MRINREGSCLISNADTIFFLAARAFHALDLRRQPQTVTAIPLAVPANEMVTTVS